MEASFPGVTTHSPHDLDFPSTMTNVRSGTWMMTGNGVMHNGTTVIDDYGLNLDKLKEGDRVAVVRKEPGGTLHFFVNSEDQVSALEIPQYTGCVVLSQTIFLYIKIQSCAWPAASPTFWEAAKLQI